jgi:hypothetical protein
MHVEKEARSGSKIDALVRKTKERIVDANRDE